VEAGLDLAGLLGQGGRQRGADLELRGGKHGSETKFGGGSGQAGEGERTRLGLPGRGIAACGRHPAARRFRHRGGYQLLGGYRTRLTGLSADERTETSSSSASRAAVSLPPGLEQEEDGNESARAHALDSPVLH
jgi:hypothetical protein